MKYIRIISRIIIGVLFIYSGFVKGIDPLGSTYKFIDYFNAFGMGFMTSLALPLAVLMNLLELVIGLVLLLGLRMKIASWAVTAFMSFFTVLTFVLALTNPVSDCGCFGDAIKLTNWQTFYKNLFFMIFVAIIFFQRNKYEQKYKVNVEWSIVSIAFLAGLYLSIHCYRHLPIIDFRPFHIGANIPDGMKVPEGMPHDEYETILTYEKDGIVKDFTSENYPWQDTTWKFVDSKSTLIKKGYEPPIHDFNIEGKNGDIVEEVLQDEGYSFLFISHKLLQAKTSCIEKINKIAILSQEKGYRFIGLTPASENDIKVFKDKFATFFDFYATDEIVLKTIIRSNPGLVLIKDGTIIYKWHCNDIPSIDNLQNNLLSYTNSLLKAGQEKSSVLILIFSAVMTFFIFKANYKV